MPLIERDHGEKHLSNEYPLARAPAPPMPSQSDGRGDLPLPDSNGFNFYLNN